MYILKGLTADAADPYPFTPQSAPSCTRRVSEALWEVLEGSQEVLGEVLGGTEDVEGSLGHPGRVLGGPWGGFEGLLRSLGQSWEVRMFVFRWF